MRAVSTFGGCKPKAAFSCADFTEGMAPVSAAEKAALDVFFKGKRGERKLIEHPPMRGRNWTNAERWCLGGRVTSHVCALEAVWDLSGVGRVVLWLVRAAHLDSWR